MNILPFDGIRKKLSISKVIGGITVDDGYAVASTGGEVIAHTREEEIAMAIAGIPAMYGAMRYALGLLDDGLASPEEIDRACDALHKGMAKARGE
jgi:hypothetical protein